MFCSGASTCRHSRTGRAIRSRRSAGTGRVSRTYGNSRTSRCIMRANGRIRTETNRPKVRTTIRMECSLISHPMRCRVMVEISISVPIKTCIMKMRTIMRSTIGTIMVRHTEIEQAVVRVVDINAEVPSSSRHIYRAIEIIGIHEPAILPVAQHPTEIIITNIQCFVVIIQSPFIAACHIIHDIADRIDKVVINLVSVIVLLSTQIQFVCHLVRKKTCLLTHLAGTHSSHHGHTGTQTDSKE